MTVDWIAKQEGEMQSCAATFPSSSSQSSQAHRLSGRNPKYSKYGTIHCIF